MQLPPSPLRTASYPTVDFVALYSGTVLLRSYRYLPEQLFHKRLTRPLGSKLVQISVDVAAAVMTNSEYHADVNDAVPYWNVNVAKEKWTTECPEALKNMAESDEKHLLIRDEEFHRMSWEDVQRVISEYWSLGAFEYWSVAHPLFRYKPSRGLQKSSIRSKTVSRIRSQNQTITWLRNEFHPKGASKMVQCETKGRSIPESG